jgi:hypothetical protein
MFLSCLGPLYVGFSALLTSVAGVPLSSRVAVNAMAKIESVRKKPVLDRAERALSQKNISSRAFLQTADHEAAAALPAMTACPRDELELNTHVTETQKEKLRKMASSIRLGKAGSHLRIGCAFKLSRLSRQRSLDAIQTWGRRCDAIYAFSDEDWTLPGDMNVKTIPLRQHNNDYEHLWQKTQMMFQNLSQDFWDRDRLDFVIMADDDAFFIMENLRAFLDSEPIRAKQFAGKPVIVGDLWEGPKEAPKFNVWVNGGGYVFNRVVADEVSRCTHQLAQENVIPEDVMVCSCMVRSNWEFDFYKESNGCDSAGRKMFSQENLLTTWGKNDATMSSDLIEFHHTVGEERYYFFRMLYNDVSARLCADAGARELEGLRAGIRHMRNSRNFAWSRLAHTMDTGKWKVASLLSDSDRAFMDPQRSVPCAAGGFPMP